MGANKVAAPRLSKKQIDEIVAGILKWMKDTYGDPKTWTLEKWKRVDAAVVKKYKLGVSYFERGLYS